MTYVKMLDKLLTACATSGDYQMALAVVDWMEATGKREIRSFFL